MPGLGLAQQRSHVAGESVKHFFADGADARMGEGHFLRQIAHEAAAHLALAGVDLAEELQKAVQPVERILLLHVSALDEVVSLLRAIMPKGGLANLFLALEIMEEAALRHLRGLA